MRNTFTTIKDIIAFNSIVLLFGNKCCQIYLALVY